MKHCTLSKVIFILTILNTYMVRAASIFDRYPSVKTVGKTYAHVAQYGVGDYPELYNHVIELGKRLHPLVINRTHAGTGLRTPHSNSSNSSYE